MMVSHFKGHVSMLFAPILRRECRNPQSSHDEAHNAMMIATTSLCHAPDTPGEPRCLLIAPWRAAFPVWKFRRWGAFGREAVKPHFCIDRPMDRPLGQAIGECRIVA